MRFFTGLLAAVAALAPGSQADIPVHCTYPQITGKWTYQLYATDDYSSCTASEIDKQTATGSFTVTLSEPNVATDASGNTGTWTLVYDEGIMIELGGNKYFSYFEYEKKSDGTSTSFCGYSLGWMHEIVPGAASQPTQWQCIAGTAANADARTSSFKVLDPIGSIPEDAVVEEKAELAARINAAGLPWKAKAKPHFYGMKMRDAVRQMGVPLIKPPVELPKAAKVGAVDPTSLGLPSEFSWTNVSGVDFVPPVRHQDSCGSCYSFGSTEAMGARLRIQTNNADTTVLSPQDVVTCSDQSQGCDGGFPMLVGFYAEAFGIVPEECFPYEGPIVNGTTSPDTCLQRKCKSPSNIYRTSEYGYTGGYYTGVTEENMLTALVNTGPLAVSFNVTAAFQQYDGGVFVQPSAEVMGDDEFVFGITNHVVEIYGYGTLDGTPYWSVRNSWGTSWGLSGDFMIRRGTNELNIETMAVSFGNVFAQSTAASQIQQK